MPFKLRPYQAEVVDDVFFYVHQKQEAYCRKATNTAAIGLVAPTASGKTVMAAALLERLIFDGDGKVPPNPDLTVIWLSDQPDLNEQSKKKIRLASSRFNNRNLVRLIDCDQDVLDGGKVYFTHLQQLAKGATTAHAAVNGVVNDDRHFGVWDMIANSIERKGADVLIVIDEAHRGTGIGAAGAKDLKTRTTLFHTLIHGGVTTIGTKQPAAPITIGISATPDKFLDSIARSAKSVEVVAADVAKVRASGLLKDVINIPAPTENQSAAMTLLGDAVRRWSESAALWTEYHGDHPETRLIEPILVVQLADKPSATMFEEVLNTLAKGDPTLKSKAIAHSFGEHEPIAVAPAPGESEKREIRYLSPQDVDGDPDVKAVLFKTALTTGWDCPRAEVMVSLRVADDPTTIAQLMGRMVRTPLADRVTDGDEALNSVTLMLPLFDSTKVAQVVEALTKDGDTAARVDVSTVNLVKNAAVDEECFALLASIPSSERVPPPHKSEVSRAISLAGLLDDYSEKKSARKELSTRITSAIQAFDAQHSEDVTKKADDLLTLEMRDVAHQGDDQDLYSKEGVESEGYTLRVATADIVATHRKAVRAWPEGMADEYERHLLANPDSWEHSRWAEGTLEDIEAQAHIAALHSLGVVEEIESAAVKQIELWKDKRKSEVSRFKAAVQGQINALWDAKPQVMGDTSILVPEIVKNVATETLVPASADGQEPATVALPLLDKNLYGWSERGHRYPVKYGSSWEREVLDKELGEPTCKGWYRNPSSGKHALAIPYQAGDALALLHPDFLFFHRADDEDMVVDVVDPHRHSDSDTGAKWRALAAYAAAVADSDNPGWLRNVVAVIKVGETLRALDLRDPQVVELMADVMDKPGVESVFAAKGYDY